MSDARDQLTKVLVVFLLAAAIGFGVLQGNSSAGKVPKGKQAPAFTVDKLAGGRASRDDFHGKVTLVAFWGTWCEPCREELPHLVQLADEYQDKGATLLAINDYQEEHGAMPDFVAKQLPGLKPYAAWGNEDVFSKYGIEVFPTLYVLDTNGSVVASWRGLASIDRVRSKVDAAIAGRRE